MELLVFTTAGSLAVLSAVFVILLKNPVYNALSLIATLLFVAVIFLLLDAPFVAALQLIVYAGAIMVLFLFVIMLLSVKEEKKRKIQHQFLTAVPIVLLVFLELIAAGRVAMRGRASTMAGTVEDLEILSTKLISQYFLPFEIASILLLAAIIGAVVVVRKQEGTD